MSRAARYIEAVSVVDDNYADGETIETVTINEALIACKIERQEILKEIRAEFDNKDMPLDTIAILLDTELNKLDKELRNIKIK